MSNTPAESAVIDALRQALQGVPRMSEAADISQLFVRSETPEKARRFFRVCSPGVPLEVRIADHFDLQVDALVHDGELGSLGLVYFLSATGEDKERLRRRIDEAAYVRHLLLEDLRPGSVQSGQSPYAVEVVFALPPAVASPSKPAGPAGDGAQKTSSDIGDVLRDIVREGSYLDAVGMNLWRLAPADGDPSGDTGFRRAFSWLLVDAEKWYAETPSATPLAGNGRLRSVDLRNFRVAGSRHWELEPDCPLHLIHGHNGSGKSSLCEALELAVTGKIERLADANHAEVITNCVARQRGSRAEITLAGIEKDNRTWEVKDAGIEEPLAKDLAAASFRLDQTLADALSHGDSAARARLFLQAFFAKERSELDNRDAAWKRAAAVFEKLPKRLQTPLTNESGKLDLSRASSALQWLASESVKREELIKLLPFDSSQLAAVRALLPTDTAQKLEGTGALTVTEIEEAIRLIDPALRGLADNVEQKVEVLKQAVDLLEEFGEASITGLAPETEDLGKLLNQWLEHLALTDLMEKEDQVLATVEESRRRGHEFDPQCSPTLTGLENAPSAEARQKLLAGVRARRDELRLRVAGFTTAAERAAQAGKPLPPIDHRHPESLDKAASWGAFGPLLSKTLPSLGAAVREAFVQHRIVEVMSGPSVVLRAGEPGWGKELLSLALRSRATYKVIEAQQQELRDEAGCLQRLWTNLRQFREHVGELAKIDADLLERFLSLIGGDSPLSRAINEVMALLTPARWAYDDISTRAELESGEQRLDVQTTDNVPAKLRLNTAELNTFALTLFLLCARRAPIPLRMIVLDDPLQNIDELTVTTLARGLGRLLRLWQRVRPEDALRIVMVLHSEGSLERIRSEIPCAAYFLPWLSPPDEPSVPGRTEPRVFEGERDPRRIRPSHSRLKPALQALDQLIRETPRSEDRGPSL